MKKVDLRVNFRECTGKGDANRLRKESYIPAVLYGNESAGAFLKINEAEISKLISKNGEHVIFKLKLDDTEIPAIIKEVQRDLLNHKLVHIDFKPVLLHEVIHADVPIFVVNGERVEKNGWVINRQLTNIEVEGEVEKIPPAITIDLANYRSGDVLKVSDIEISNELSIISDANEVILSIIQSKQAPAASEQTEKQVDSQQI